MIPQEQIESNPDLLVEDYNVAKYLEALNKRIESLLVCFDTDIRDRILIGLEKDKKTKVNKLFTNKNIAKPQKAISARIKKKSNISFPVVLLLPLEF